MSDPARQKADLIVAAAGERKAFDPVLLGVDELSSLADYFFICSCRSSRQTQAVADHIMRQVKKSGGHKPLGVEGASQGHWILIDYGEVIVHVFYHPYRELYDLDNLWLEAQRIDLDLEHSSYKTSQKTLDMETPS